MTVEAGVHHVFDRGVVVVGDDRGDLVTQPVEVGQELRQPPPVFVAPSERGTECSSVVVDEVVRDHRDDRLDIASPERGQIVQADRRSTHRPSLQFVSDVVTQLVDRQQITDVIYRYCRGIDRCQFDLVRSCYHPDAIDLHGAYQGGVDGFIDYVTHQLATYEMTQHMIGNLLIELDGDQARVESYVQSIHRIPPSAKHPQARDFWVGLRYVDDFERRAYDDGDQWRIAKRVCVLDWTRTDPVPEGGWKFTDVDVIGRRDATDPVFNTIP